MNNDWKKEQQTDRRHGESGRYGLFNACAVIRLNQTRTVNKQVGSRFGCRCRCFDYWDYSCIYMKKLINPERHKRHRTWLGLSRDTNAYKLHIGSFLTSNSSKEIQKIIYINGLSVRVMNTINRLYEYDKYGDMFASPVIFASAKQSTTTRRSENPQN